jgi:8-oxo-dGTP pyrophosphatase MutT (NUDIX family)
MQSSDVLPLLDEFDPAGDGEAVKSRELIRMLMEYASAPFSRHHFTPGHITCTAAVLSPDFSKVLLIHHRRLDRWLLPGGHVESEDVHIWDAAAREAFEETGVQLALRAVPHLVGIDVHGIPPKREEPLHLHHDLIFAFLARSESCRVTREIHEVAWCPLSDFDRYDLPGSIRRSVARAVQVLPRIQPPATGV